MRRPNSCSSGGRYWGVYIALGQFDINAVESAFYW